MHPSAAGGHSSAKGPPLPRRAPQALPSAPQRSPAPQQLPNSSLGSAGERSREQKGSQLPAPRGGAVSSPSGGAQLPSPSPAVGVTLPRGERAPLDSPAWERDSPAGESHSPAGESHSPRWGEPTPWGAPLPLSSPFAPPSDSPELPGCPSLIYPRRQPDRRQRLGAPEQMSSIRAWVNQGRAPGESIAGVGSEFQWGGSSWGARGAWLPLGELRGSPLGERGPFI